MMADPEPDHFAIFPGSQRAPMNANTNRPDAVLLTYTFEMQALTPGIDSPHDISANSLLLDPFGQAVELPPEGFGRS